MPSPDNALHLLVIGDSLPFAAFCPGCTGFVTQYAEELETRTGRPVIVSNRSRNDSAGILQIKTQVLEETRLREQIAAADVVIVSVGYNNALPDPATGVGCQGDVATVEGYITWALATEPECLQDGIDTYAAEYDLIFSTIVELRNGAKTVFAALNVHDGNLGGPDFVGAKVSQETKADMDRWIVAAYDRWNTMLCDRATHHGFACVDIYHAFNAPAGDKPSGSFTVDGAHPSQLGNDVIAELLAMVDITPIGR